MKYLKIILALSTLLMSPIRASSIQGQHLHVVVFACRPVEETCLFINREGQYGSYTYQGFLMDLITELSNKLNFTFTIHEGVNNVSPYGERYENGVWTGMVWELMEGMADLALADLTITEDRESVIDFSTPYLSLGLGVLYSKAGAHRITSIEQVAQDTSIKVGTVGSCATIDWLKTSKESVYQKIWAKMANKSGPPYLLTNNNLEGRDLVLDDKDNYAFIMETPHLDFMLRRDCRLTKMDQTFGKRNYGLGLPQGSPYKEELDREILRLQESGRMQKMFNMWMGPDTCGSSVKSYPFILFGLVIHAIFF